MIQVEESSASCALCEISGLPDVSKGRAVPARVFVETIIDILDDKEDVVTCHDQWDDAKDEYKQVLDIDEDLIPPFFLMSQAVSPRTRRVGWVEQFARYIDDQDLGSVIQSDPGTNPNTGNRVIIFIWQVHLEGLVRWIKKNYVD